jgi:hypothetical protein
MREYSGPTLFLYYYETISRKLGAKCIGKEYFIWVTFGLNQQITKEHNISMNHVLSVKDMPQDTQVHAQRSDGLFRTSAVTDSILN